MQANASNPFSLRCTQCVPMCSFYLLTLVFVSWAVVLKYICHGTDKNPIINKLRMAVNKRVCQSVQCEQTRAYPLHQCVRVNSSQGGIIRLESRHLTNTVLCGYRVQVVEVKQYKILLTNNGEQPVTITKYILKQQESLVLKHPAPVVRFTKMC